MSLLRRLNRPEYFFRPRATVKRLRQGNDRAAVTRQTRTASLAWSQEMTVFGDELGRTILASGVFDICVTEVIHRLVEPGDTAIDVGANIGYLTNLMLMRAGPAGSVTAIEPHPEVFEVLERNARRWDADPRLASLKLLRLALSNQTGTGTLRSPGNAGHMGLASLAGENGPGADEFTVELAKLDNLFPAETIGLLKLDVEGHEHSVLQGAGVLLDAHSIRDVVFEEHAIYPAPSMLLLEERDMTVFSLRHSLVGLIVRHVEEGPAPPGWPGPNYLATRDPERALRLLRPRGWRSLGGAARLSIRNR